MANSFFSFCLALSVIATPVFAGNRAWEPPVRGGHTTEELSFQDPLAFSEQNETTSRRSLSPEKRWITIKPGKDAADDKLWPDREITYCFDTPAARTATFDDLKDAKQLWTNNGLSEAFKWTLGSDSFCSDSSNRAKFLLIKFDSNGGMGTTVGIPAILAGSSVNGPTMQLTDSLEMGMMNVVANYAHEMGHAWGMHHEHQNQRFWGEGYSESGGTYWGPERWNCQNLKDYAATLEKIQKLFPGGEGTARMNAACKSRTKALALGFSAFDYLPIVDDPVNASNKKEPDWDSIMIYPSGAGGTGPASGGVDNRAPILLKPDGSRIEKVYKPSERDIKGLTDLYGGALSAKLSLLNDKSNPAKSIFDKLRKKDKDSGCA